VYSKVFAQIFESSIAEDHVVRHVFMDLLVLANKHGEVDMTMASIARRTNVPLEVVARAIAHLTSPDPFSRTALEEGRRLVLIDDHRDWGWRIVNFPHYNAMRNEDARREYFREYKRNYRNKKNNNIEENVQDKTGQSTPVHTSSTNSTPTDTDTYTSSDTTTPTPTATQKTEKQQSSETGKITCTKPTQSVFSVLEPDESGRLPAGCLPLNDGRGWRPKPELIDEWQALYPAIDVRQCLRDMRGWLDAARERRKTLKGIQRFVNSWLSRQHDKQNMGAINGTRNLYQQPSRSERTLDAARAAIQDVADRLGLGQTGYPSSGEGSGEA